MSTGPDQSDQLGPPHHGPAVTRSEERLRIDLRKRPYERLMVRKVVVTEQVSITVEVRREELRVKRIPVPEPTDHVRARDDADGLGSPDLEDGEVLAIVLSSERPVVTLQTVPVEHVRIIKDIVLVTHEVEADLQSERVGVDREHAE